MSSELEHNKELVRQYYKIATSDLKGIENVVSDTFVDHHFPPTLPPGPEGVRQFFTNVLGSAFSDMQIVHSDMIAEGNKVICEFALRARHTADFAGIPAKGNEILCAAFSKFRVEEGKLTEAWELADIAGLFDQMKK